MSTIFTEEKMFIVDYSEFNDPCVEARAYAEVSAFLGMKKVFQNPTCAKEAYDAGISALLVPFANNVQKVVSEWKMLDSDVKTRLSNCAKPLVDGMRVLECALRLSMKVSQYDESYLETVDTDVLINKQFVEGFVSFVENL
jgi:hypothetical protein